MKLPQFMFEPDGMLTELEQINPDQTKQEIYTKALAWIEAQGATIQEQEQDAFIRFQGVKNEVFDGEHPMRYNMSIRIGEDNTYSLMIHEVIEYFDASKLGCDDFTEEEAMLLDLESTHQLIGEDGDTLKPEFANFPQDFAKVFNGLSHSLFDAITK